MFGRGGSRPSDAIAPMNAKAYPNPTIGANSKNNADKTQGRTMTKINADSALSRRGIIKGAAALAAGVATPALLGIRSAYAAYPDRPVKIVVANTPGGPSDIVGRITAAALQQSTGKTFIIENIGGAGSNIGMVCRALRTGWLHHPARDQCLFDQRHALQQDPV